MFDSGNVSPAAGRDDQEGRWWRYAWLGGILFVIALYALYLMTYALDSVGDVFCSFAAVAAGLLVMRSGALPRWLGWFVSVAGILFFLQGFGLGGVIASFGLVLDLIGFVLFLIFILVSSVILLRRQPAAAGTAGVTRSR